MEKEDSCIPWRKKVHAYLVLSLCNSIKDLKSLISPFFLLFSHDKFLFEMFVSYTELKVTVNTNVELVINIWMLLIT